MLKPVQIAKIIVCSLLASAILSACQKNPSRPLKAILGGNNSKPGQFSFAECNSKSLELLKHREDVLVKIAPYLEIAKHRELDNTQKIELKKLGVDLEAFTNLAVDEIKAIKNPKPNAGEGCEHVDSKNPTKKIQYKIKEILEQETQTQANIVLATKSPKTSSGEDGDGTPDKPAQDQILEKEVYKFSERLIEGVFGLEANISLFVTEHTVSTFTEEQKIEFLDLAVESKKNYCKLENISPDGELTKESLFKVVLVDSITVKAKDKTDATRTRVVMMAEDQKLVSWVCQINKNSEVQKLLRQTFGKSLVFVEKK